MDARVAAGNRSEQGSSAPGLVLLLARCITAAGVVRAATGVAAWFTVRSQLADERIVIPESASRLGGRAVKGPITAFEEANAIKRIARGATGGRTYGELDEEDPAAETAMDASLLRSSLFTSVLAFGVAAAEFAHGILLVATGTALAGVAHRLRRLVP